MNEGFLFLTQFLLLLQQLLEFVDSLLCCLFPPLAVPLNAYAVFVQLILDQQVASRLGVQVLDLVPLSRDLVLQL